MISIILYLFVFALAPYIAYFYDQLFKDMCHTSKITADLINRYVAGILYMEREGKTKYMFEALDNICNYVSDNAEDKDMAYVSVRALERLFEYLTMGSDNGTGVKIGKLSKQFFTSPFQKTYNKVFFKMNPDMNDCYRNRDEDKRVNFISTFYQEFIASSEISAILAGQLTKELYSQQRTLAKDHPVAKLINALV